MMSQPGVSAVAPRAEASVGAASTSENSLPGRSTSRAGSFGARAHHECQPEDRHAAAELVERRDNLKLRYETPSDGVAPIVAARLVPGVPDRPSRIEHRHGCRASRAQRGAP
mmetsp:Transcript_2268/g.7528  ORF Transcript_2268/g.7528 Transcript_2268/m.7528 type:complete len:112 (-) Transcript_2268:41-376(-)